MHSMIKRVTLSDVAKVCGVTPATVSRVLNDKAEFTASEAVRERIIQTARKLGYVPDLSAQISIDKKRTSSAYSARHTPTSQKALTNRCWRAAHRCCILRVTMCSLN